MPGIVPVPRPLSLSARRPCPQLPPGPGKREEAPRQEQGRGASEGLPPTLSGGIEPAGARLNLSTPS